MARHTAEWWTKRVEELAQGGSAAKVARRHGVSERTLLWWRSELRRRFREGASSTPAPRLLPVTVTDSPTKREATEATLVMELERGAARVTLRGVVTPDLVGALVAALRPC
jgi:transposase-like protein